MPRRPRWRAYLLLARISNLPTVWTNTLAAYVVAGAPLDSFWIAAVSLSLFYTSGMFLNDVCDAAFDARSRPDRPIPNGDVSRGEALAIAIALIAAGTLLLFAMPSPTVAIVWAVALVGAIVTYDLSHKGKSYGPVVMGLCRALVYCVAASGASGAVSSLVLIAAAVMWIYVIALTVVAKAANLGHAVPWMLAGICLVDALIIAAAGNMQMALIAAAGFVVTLAFQRVVPGT